MTSGRPSSAVAVRAFGPKPRDYSYASRARCARARSAARSRSSCRRAASSSSTASTSPRSRRRTSRACSGSSRVPKSSVIVDAADNQNLRLSARNLDKHQFLPPEGVNVYDVLRHEHLILTKGAVAALEARCK
ncbi:MAG: 50S ribosomal protein L4 [Sandaracinaceae bacterium]